MSTIDIVVTTFKGVAPIVMRVRPDQPVDIIKQNLNRRRGSIIDYTLILEGGTVLLPSLSFSFYNSIKNGTRIQATQRPGSVHVETNKPMPMYKFTAPPNPENPKEMMEYLREKQYHKLERRKAILDKLVKHKCDLPIIVEEAYRMDDIGDELEEKTYKITYDRMVAERRQQNIADLKQIYEMLNKEFLRINEQKLLMPIEEYIEQGPKLNERLSKILEMQQQIDAKLDELQKNE